MANPPPLRIFISYSHNDTDRPLLEKLRRHLAPLVQAGKISIWDDSQILPGDKWDTAIRQNLDRADIVVFLVSSDYLASDYVNRIEVPVAMQRAEAGECTIVPVLLRACLFDWMPYAQFEFLPKTSDNQRLVPVDNWPRTDDALEVVVRRIGELVKTAAAAAPPPPPAGKFGAEKTPGNSSGQISAATAGKIGPEKTPGFSGGQFSAISDLERRGFEQQLTLATQKLQRLQTALLLETDAGRQFAYEHEIQKLEALATDLKQKLQP